MANPKKRKSPRRRDMRRSHDHLSTVSLDRCSNCQNLTRRHHVCPNCGYYKRRQIIETEW